MTSNRDQTKVTPAGKLLRRGTERFWVKGVTYGTFAPDEPGRHFPPAARVAADFALMRSAGINTVRTYTMPDEYVLDLASEHGLAVMAGVAWAQHVAFLDDRQIAANIRDGVRSQVAAMAGHPAVFMIALGNEIPAPVVRWLGPQRVERFLWTLYDDAKSAAPEALLTYVNYPPTEYLNLPFVDVVSFNVYLHDADALSSYLAHLQSLAGHKPLLVAETGADSIREGLARQATLTGRQIRTAFAAGACGAITFAFTDEWWRGGLMVEDWHFGLVDAARRPKPALAAVTEALADVPFPPATRASWPTVSVVICAFNAARTIGECLEALVRLRDHPLEIIVVDDGSTDGTAEIARTVPGVRVLEASHAGLSVARNLGAEAARGEIVAYLDADAYPDQDWLTFLVHPFLSDAIVAAGGPNVVPPDDPWLAQCVARAPGGPTHVLLDERTAEHVPGCNLAIRRDALLGIGGFNPIYLRAGDDVDVCWRLQANGGKVAFAPAALVWHHHRASIRAYWRQQVGYGEGQAWLVPHHPDKFDGRHIMWHGHIYSPLPFVRALSRPRVNTGIWGTAAFPSVYHTNAHVWTFLPHTVRWQALAALALTVGTVVALLSGDLWPMVLAAAGGLGLLVTIARCLLYACVSDIETLPPIGRQSLRASHLTYRLTIAWLHFLQPFARGWGQLRGYVTKPGGPIAPLAPAPLLARRPGAPAPADLRRAAWLIAQRPLEGHFWSERWIFAADMLSRLTDRLRRSPLTSALEADDGWQLGHDVRVAVGWLARLDIRVLVEDHAGGRQLIRIGQRLQPAPGPLAALVLCTLAIGLAVVTGGVTPAGTPVLALAAIALVGWLTWRTATVLAEAERALHELMQDIGARAVPQPAPRRIFARRSVRAKTDRRVEEREERWSA